MEEVLLEYLNGNREKIRVQDKASAEQALTLLNGVYGVGAKIVSTEPAAAAGKAAVGPEPKPQPPEDPIAKGLRELTARADEHDREIRKAEKRAKKQAKFEKAVDKAVAARLDRKEKF